MLSFLADENFNADIVRGLLRRHPGFDVLSVHDVGLTGAEDPQILEWAASADRLLLTHDVNTIPGFAKQRVQAGLPMPGVVAVSAGAPVGPVIDDLLLLADCSIEGEWEAQVVFLPL